MPHREQRATAGIPAKAPQIPAGSRAWDRRGDRMTWGLGRVLSSLRDHQVQSP